MWTMAERDALIVACTDGDVALIRQHIPPGKFLDGPSSSADKGDEFDFLFELEAREPCAPVDALVDARGFNLLDLICEAALLARAQGTSAQHLAATALELIVNKGAAVSDHTLSLLYEPQERGRFVGFANKVQRFRRTIGLFGLAAFGFDDLGQSRLVLSQGWAIRRLYGMTAVVHSDLLSANIAASCQQLHPAFLELLEVRDGGSPLRQFATHMAAQHDLMNSILDNHAHRFLTSLLKTPRFEQVVLRQAQLARTPEAAHPISPLIQHTILLADDHLDYRIRVAGWLIARGYRVVEARDGKEAFAYFSTYRSEIELILTDFCMPEMDGFNLAVCVRELDPDLPLVIHTTPPIHPDLRLEANRLGVRLICKHDETVLFQTVRDVFGHQRFDSAH